MTRHSSHDSKTSTRGSNRFQRFRQQLIDRGHPAIPIELPHGYSTLFVARTGEESNHAHLFRADGEEAGSPLIAFRDEVDFAACIVDLRKAVLSGRHTVEGFWHSRTVVIGQADPDRDARKTVEEKVYGEIDALERLHVFTPVRAQALKRVLTSNTIQRHVREGMTVRDMIDRYNRLGE